MSTCNNSMFKHWLKNTLNKILQKESLLETLECLSEEITQKYPNIKIWFTRKYGKRLSYITGNGREHFLPPVKIDISKNYSAFIENLSVVPEKEAEILVSLFKVVLGLYDAE
ncbi:MAG: hypothetical protein PWQ82_551 [Thermosediminibacterales bacterium]|nr:hypothetical protein [Thermosediminibacterales bacterium]MDK2835964.1 hypothetical protein [Thermosediminibacterales bacterium]